MDILAYGTYVQVLGQYQYPAVEHGLSGICPTTLGYTGGQRWLQIKVDGQIGWADARWLYFNGVYDGIPRTFSWAKAQTFEARVIARTDVVSEPLNLVVRSAPTWGQTVEQAIPATVSTGRVSAVLGPDRGQIDDGALNRFDNIASKPCSGLILAIGRTGDNLWIEIVSADGVHGWVYHQYLEVLGNADSLPITYGAPDLDGVGMCARVDTFLRLGPGMEYQEVGVIRQNQTVIAYDQTNDLEWIQVETLDGLFGWSNRLMYQESNTGIRVMPAPPPPYTVDLESMPVCNEFLGTNPSIEPTPEFQLGTFPLPAGLMLVYNIEPVPLRGGAGYEYAEIGYVRYVEQNIPGFGASDVAQLLVVLGFDTTQEWVYVQATDGQRGWARTSSFRVSPTHEPLITEVTPQLGELVFSPLDRLAYNIETVTVRSGPNLNYQELGTLQFVGTFYQVENTQIPTSVGQLVKVLARSSDSEWILVQATDGLVGWAYRRSFYDNTTLLPIDVSDLRIVQ